MRDKKVDVILPNYNKAQFIDECLDSLQAQTYPYWRCIVIDGYSDDGSWEILQRRAATDDRFELHRLDRIGLYRSWNVGLDRVGNSYFAILTSDDTWEEAWLETAVEVLDAHPAAVAAAARTYHIDADSNVEDLAMLNRYGESILGNGEHQRIWDGFDYAITCFFMGSVVTSVHSVVVRSDILDSMRFAVDDGPFADWGWCAELGLHGNIVHCPKVRAYWRRYEGQASDTDLVKRTEHGEALKALFEQLRERILNRLHGSRRTAFKRASSEHLEVYMPYFFQRPPLHVLKVAPIRSFFRLIRLAVQYPRIFTSEVMSFIRRESWYINERRKDLAEHVLATPDGTG